MGFLSKLSCCKAPEVVEDMSSVTPQVRNASQNGRLGSPTPATSVKSAPVAFPSRSMTKLQTADSVRSSVSSSELIPVVDPTKSEVFEALDLASKECSHRILRPMQPSVRRERSVRFSSTGSSFTWRTLSTSMTSEMLSESSRSTASHSILQASASRLRRVHETPRIISKSSSTNSISSFDSRCTSDPGAMGMAADQVASTFANKFLQAIWDRNTKWANDADVFGLFTDNARMIASDNQRFTGKTAILRRLNTGVEQLVGLLDKHVGDHDMKDMAKPTVKVVVPDKKRPGYVTVTYTLKWGMRKFTFLDEFLVSDGKVRKLKRSRS